jgi:SNF2 family DNA or RNA helicase
VAVPLLRVQEEGGEIEIKRDGSISDELWLALRAELGAGYRHTAERLIVPVERFLARRSPVARLCKQFQVGLELDQGVRELLERANDERTLLSERLNDGAPLTSEEVRARLEGTRFDRDLRSFQERDLGVLLTLPHGANFSVPGAGKTAVTYAVYEAERAAGRVERLLVIAPLSSFEAWTEEAEGSFESMPTIQRFSDRIDADAEVLVVNYHRLVNNYELIAEWVAAAPTMVVLDEAHRMKRGWEGEWGRACLSLAYLARRRDVLTGTPAPQSPYDFVALLDFLWPNQALRILPADAVRGAPPPDAGHRVAQAIRPLFVRTRKEELDLPDIDYDVVEVPVEGLHKEIYEALRDRYRGRFAMGRRERVSLAQMGTIVMYLLEAATNPRLLAAGSTDGDPEEFRHPPLDVPEGSSLAQLISDYNLYETPRKFVELGRLVQANASAGRKTLIWSNFVRNLKTLERELRGYQPALIHGAVPAFLPDGTEGRSRERELERFRHDEHCQVLLANPQALGEGVSLHKECHDAIYLDRTFNAGQYLQSEDRIHRLGLEPTDETRITFLISAGTVDETVDRRVAGKVARLGEMLDDPDLTTLGLPDEEDYGPAVDSVEDVEALFRHLRGEDD